GARGRLRGGVAGDAEVREGERERALDPGLVLRGRGRGEVWIERLVEGLVSAVKTRIERRDGVEAAGDGHPARTFAAMPSRIVRRRPAGGGCPVTRDPAPA